MIEVSYTEDYFSYGPFGKDDYDEDIIRMARQDFFPSLTWMAQLQKLAIIKRGCGMSTAYPDEMVLALLRWIFGHYEMDQLHRLWIQDHYSDKVASEIEISNDSMQSLLMGTNFKFDDKETRFRQLKHVGGIVFSDLAHLPHLRYIRGYCVSEDVN